MAESARVNAPVHSDNQVPIRIRMGWGVGSYGVAILLNTYTALLLFYLTNVIGMRLELAGLLMFIAKMYDVATDLPMGIISDHTRSRWGRRRPYLFASSFLCGICFIMMFNVPFVGEAANSTGAAVYVLGALLLYATGYTMFNVPYLAMPAEMSTSYRERTAIMSFRVIFIQFGIITAVGVAPRIAQAFGGGIDGYGVVGWTLGLAAMASMLASFFGTAGATQVEKTSVEYTVGEQIRSALDNQPFILLSLYKLLVLFSTATVISSLLFIIKNVLNFDQGVALYYSLIYAAASVISVPLFWVPFSNRIGKHRALIIATLGYLLLALSWLLADADETLAIFLARALALGFFGAGKLLLGMTLLPDVMEYDYLRTGLRREGVFAGGYSFVEKSAFALSPLVMTLIMGLLGYQETVDNAYVQQSDDALAGIYFNIAIIPALCNAAAMVILLRWNLTEQRLKDMQQNAPFRSGTSSQV